MLTRLSLPLGEFSPRSTRPLRLTPFSTLPFPRLKGPQGLTRGGRPSGCTVGMPVPFFPFPEKNATAAPAQQRHDGWLDCASLH